jgi:hypothetical protein
MIVERWTWQAKQGCREDLIGWCRKLREREENRGQTMRIYSTQFGTWNKVTLEHEHETEEARQQYWAGVEWTEELGEFVKTRDDMTESGQTRELLSLH